LAPSSTWLRSLFFMRFPVPSLSLSSLSPPFLSFFLSFFLSYHPWREEVKFSLSRDAHQSSLGNFGPNNSFMLLLLLLLLGFFLSLADEDWSQAGRQAGSSRSHTATLKRGRKEGELARDCSSFS
jgi:hypothetical protein